MGRVVRVHRAAIPCFFSRLATVSDGTAPRPSQYLIRSAFELNLRRRVLVLGVIGTQLFEHPPVARGPGVHRLKR